MERSSRRKLGNCWKLRSRSALRSAVACGRDVRGVDEVGDVLALAGERADHSVGVARELRQHPVLACERAEHLVGLAQCRVRTLDDLRELLAAGREAGAEAVDDQPEAVRIRLAHDVVDEVEVDRRAVAVERQQILARTRLVLGNQLELRRRLGARSARLRRLTLDELLADQRLRADQAGGVGAEVLEPGLGDLEDDDRLARIGGAVLADDLVRRW